MRTTTTVAKMSATAATKILGTPVITAAPTALALAAAGLGIDVGDPSGMLFYSYIYIFYHAEYLKVECTYE